nr:hypothetical protein [Pandoravirus massiliensis]
MSVPFPLDARCLLGDGKKHFFNRADGLHIYVCFFATKASGTGAVFFFSRKKATSPTGLFSDRRAQTTAGNRRAMRRPFFVDAPYGHAFFLIRSLHAREPLVLVGSL